MANIVLDAVKGKGVSSSYTLNQGDSVSLSGFDLSQAQMFVNELGQLIIVLIDGTQFMLSNFTKLLADFPEATFISNVDTADLTYSDVIAKFLEGASSIEPALGPDTTATAVATNALSGGSNAATSEEGASTFDPNTSENPLTSNIVTTATVADLGGEVLVEDPLAGAAAPNVNSGTVQGPEDTTFNLNIAAPTDDDTDDATLTATVSTLPDPAAGVIQLAGVPIIVGQELTSAELTSLVFVPTADFNGTVTFDYVISDGANTTPSTQTIEVTPVADLPVVSGPSSLTVNEDSSATNLNVAIPTDADTPFGDVLTTVIDTPLASISGTITLDGIAITDSQTFTTDELARLQFEPNADFSGTITINYTTTDSDSNSVTNTHTVNVTGINDAPVVTNSSSVQDEDTIDVTLGINLPTDVDGDALTATIATLPTDGTLEFADGTPVVAGVAFNATELPNLTFTPNANFNGTVNINYVVNDGTVDVAGQHVITVNPINDAPVVTDSTSSQNEDTVDVALGIPAPTDAEGAVLSAIVATLPTDGTLKFADGTLVQAGVSFNATELTGLTFTPNADFNGTVAINYTVSDSIAPDVPGTHTITVSPLEDAPVVDGSSTSSQDEDTTANVNIPAPTDADGDVLTVVIGTLPANGTLTFADGSPVVAGVGFTVADLAGLQLTPDANFNGSVVIDYTVTDGNTAPVAGQHTVTVNSINDAPAVANSTSSQNEDTVSIDMDIPTPTDADGDALTVTIATLPTDGTIRFADGTLVQAGVAFNASELTNLTFTPNADFFGTVDINYTVSDGIADSSATHTVTVLGENDFPNVANSASSQDEDNTGTLGIPVPTDPDGDALLATIATLPTDGTLTFANGTAVVAGVGFDVAELPGLIFTPNADFNGSVGVSYEVTDGTVTIPATHTITVNSINDLPEVTDSSSSQDEDSIDVTLGINTPTDVDGDALTATIATLPTEGSLEFADGTLVQAGVAFSASELSGIRFTPNANFTGTVEINYTVSDGIGADVAGKHTVSVGNIEDSPIVTDTTSSQDEDSVDVTLGIALPTDPDDDALTATIATLPTDGTLEFADGTLVQAGVAFNATELPGLTFTPNANFNGVVSIDYTVTDGNTAPVAGNHTVTVNSVNDVPTVVDSSSSQNEDTVDVTLGINTPTDVDGDALTAIVGTLPTEGTLKFADGTLVQAGVSFNASELAGLTFTPNADFNGTVEINYSVSDGIAAGVAGKHTVSVSDVEDSPIVTDTASSQDEDTTDVTLGIALPTDPDNDALVATVGTLPTQGTLKFADGTTVQAGISFNASELPGITFTPNADFNGTVNIDYTVSDGNTAPVAGQHVITVNPINDAPVVANSTSSQNEDSVDINLGISNPTDVDGDALTATIAVLPTEGTLEFTDGTPVLANTAFNATELAGLTFTPNANFNGTVSIDYVVNDGTVNVAANHTITVNSINDAPVVTNTTSSQAEDSVDVNLGMINPTDVDGDFLTATIAGLPTEGTLKFADGSLVQAGVAFNATELAGVTFTPNADFNGTVNINYSVNDGTVDVAGQHTVTVNSSEDAPVVVDSTSNQDEDTTDVRLDINLPTDGDGDALTARIDNLPLEGTLKFADGTLVQAGVDFDANELPGLTFTPNLNFNGNVSINYSVTDGNTPRVFGNHTVTVNPVNDAPVVTNSTSTQDEDSTDVTLGINTPTDVDGDAMTATIDILPTQGALKFANGTLVQAGVAFNTSELAGITFTPNADFFGDVTINYTVTDTIDTVNGSHTVTVNEVLEPIILRYDILGLSQGIIADLDAGTVDRQNGQVDNVSNYRGIISTDFDDVIIAQNGADNFIRTGRGNDIISAGSGADTIQAGINDNDTVSYANSNAAVNIDLDNETSSGGYAEGDILSNVESLVGSTFNDTLIGDENSNALDGNFGSDILSAGAGDDVIIYDGNDISVSGGSGKDTLKVIDTFSSDHNNIDLSQVAGGTLSVSGIEVVDMNNTSYNETLHINMGDLLSSSENNQLMVRGDLILRFDGATHDDNVQLNGKSTIDILTAHEGTQFIDGVRYDVLNFGSEGTLFIENGLDILDTSGNVVM